MKAKQKSKVIYNYSARRWQRHIIPVIVWLIVLVGVIVLLTHRAVRFELKGIANAETHPVSATVTGILKTPFVHLFQEVKKEDVVAALDDTFWQKQMDVAQAKLKQLQAQMNAAGDKLKTQMLNNQADQMIRQRQFLLDIEQLRLNRLKLRGDLQMQNSRLSNLKLELDIIQNLQKQDAVSPYELKKARMNYDMQKQKIAQTVQSLQQIEIDLTNAHKRLAAFNDLPLNASTTSMDIQLETFRKNIDIQREKINQLLAEHQKLVLKSPCDGVVSSILIRPGQTVLPGQPIVTIIANNTRTIIAYANEKQMQQIKPGQKITLYTNTIPRRMSYSRVINIGPAVEQLPARLWPKPDLPQWGRPVLIEIPPQWHLTPGEIVGIEGL